MIQLRPFPAVLVLCLALLGQPACAQSEGQRDAAVRSHIRALESLAEPDGRARFERDHLASSFVAGMAPDARAHLLDQIGAAAEAAGDVTVSVEHGVFVVTFIGASSRTEVRMEVEARAPYRISALRVAAPVARVERSMIVSAASLDTIVEDFEERGFAGVISVRREGQVIIERAFGRRDPASPSPNRLDTVFGIGSRPIDFTVAAILFLEEDGSIGLDDPIGRFFRDAPPDKGAITIRQIIEGRSGLPDFIHSQADADPDLTFVSRAEMERRVFAAPLLFPPGSERRPSHAAFGLLAALIERVSGRSYASFLQTHIFQPAQMHRTGFYGGFMGLGVEQFAVGGGPRFVGEPNIPPNWGPTSWLVMGSGGMVSTLGDLRRFDQFMRNVDSNSELIAWFRRQSARSDGSDGGYDLHSGYAPDTDSDYYLMFNAQPDREQAAALARGLEIFIGLDRDG